MPRPSLADLRSEELLDAFARCVARYGLDGSTQERIAKEANIARPMLRHYLGNRDEMVSQLISHVMKNFREKTEKFFDNLPETDRIPVLMMSLFDGHAHQAENASLYQALVAASHRYEGMADQLMAFVTGFEAAVAKELTRAFPDANDARCGIVAAGITAIYFNHDAAMPLVPPAAWREKQKAAAEALLGTLR